LGVSGKGRLVPEGDRSAIMRFTIVCGAWLLLAAFPAAKMTASAEESSSAGTLVKRLQDAYGKLKDARLVAERGRADFDELKKINEDFALSWRVARVEVEYKSPDKLRMVGKIGPVTVTTIVNGDTKYSRAPLKEDKENIRDFPNKKQSGLDFGIVPGVLWTDHTVKQLPNVKIDGTECYALELTPKAGAKWGIRKMFVDAKDLRLIRFEKYDEQGSMKIRTTYLDHKKYDGVWIPSKLEVRNQEGEFGGEMLLKNIKVNTKIPDGDFATP
jgi:outer membrane lipoprotein-sorting protein